jgi:poly(hydroxyalkanoate) granule-associated protein
MATKKRDTSNSPKRRRKQSGARAAAKGSARAGTNARKARSRADSAQAQLLQGVQQIWLAGMGAISKAQREGPAAFQDAVMEGLRLLKSSRSAAQDAVRDAFTVAQETLQARVGNAREQAQETMDNIEALFQTRVQRAMRQMGVPTAAEIRVLTKRVAELNETVLKLDARERARKTSRPARARKKSAKATRTAATSGGGAEEVT